MLYASAGLSLARMPDSSRARVQEACKFSFPGIWSSAGAGFMIVGAVRQEREVAAICHTFRKRTRNAVGLSACREPDRQPGQLLQDVPSVRAGIPQEGSVSIHEGEPVLV
jgi:hypothetical protein